MVWYHGTINKLAPGTILTPAATRPGSNVYECTRIGIRSQVVWITPDIDEAFMWAEFAAEMACPDDATLYVYEVEPSSTPVAWDDPEVDSNGDPYAEYTCSSATIVCVADEVLWRNE